MTAKVVDFPSDAADNRIRVREVLTEALNDNLTEVVVIGIKDGKFYFHTSHHEGAANLLTVGNYRMAAMMSDEFDE